MSRLPPWVCGILFIATGGLTAYCSGHPRSLGGIWLQFFSVAPFAFVVASATTRPGRSIAIGVVGVLVCWTCTVATMWGMDTNGLARDPSRVYRALSVVTPGFVGAIGVTFALGFGAPQLRRLRPFLIVGAVGAVAGSIFLADLHEPAGLALGFVAWQLAVGTLLVYFARASGGSSGGILLGS